MALSGSFSGTTNNQYITPTITWSAVQSVDGNYSDVTAVLRYSRTNSGYTTSGTWAGGIRISSETKTGSTYLSISYESNSEAIRFTCRIPHNSDGSQAVTISAYGGISGTSLASTSISQMVQLDTIPRSSSLSAGNLTLGQDNTLTIQAADGGFRHDIYLFLGDASQCLLHDYAGGGSATVHPELDTFGPNIPSTTIATATLRLDTYNSAWTAQIGSKSYQIQILIPPSCVPSISQVEIQLQNSNTQLAAWGIAAAGYTKFSWQVTAQGASGSSISSISLSGGGVTATGASGTAGPLTSTGPLSFAVSAVDSRGRSTSQSKSVQAQVYPYSTPSLLDASVQRCTEAGAISDTGTYLKLSAAATCSDLGERNSVRLQYRSRSAQGSFTEWADFQSGAILSGYSIESTYQLDIRAIDLLGNTKSILFTISTAATTLHLREGGKAVGVGKYAEQDEILDVAWNALIRKNLTVRGALQFASEAKGALFDHTGVSATEYPTGPGIYRCVGVDIFNNLQSTHGTYGVLLIFKSTYAIHIYVDEYGRVFYGRSGDTFGEPTWYSMDTVVSEFDSSDGVWHVRQYANGWAECIGSKTYTGTPGEAWGSLYSLVCTPPSYPITFLNNPNTQMTALGNDGSACMLAPWGVASKTSAGQFGLVRPNQSAINVTVKFYAYGKWR